MMTERWWAVLGILVACAFCYGNALPGAFHYDDFHSIVENPAIRHGHQLPRYLVDPSLFSARAERGMYRPLLLATYALNYRLGALDPRGYLLLNWLLHVICSLLVWRLGRVLRLDARQAWAAGLIFAVHPLATEPVNYISSRSESLMAAFYMGTFLLHTRDRNRRSWCGLGCLTYGAGLLTKSVGITVPLALFLHDRWLARRPGQWRQYGGYAVVAGTYVVAITATGFLGRSLGAPARDLETQLWTQLKALLFYAQTLTMPVNLSVEPAFTCSPSVRVPATLLAGMSVLSGAIVTGMLRTRFPRVAFAVAWSGIVLLPATLMPLNMLVNDRRLYLVLAGWSWALAGELGRRRSLWGLLILLALLTVGRNPVWKSELALWRDAVNKGPGMYRAQINLGKAQQLDGDREAAMAAYGRALALAPERVDVYNNIATLLHTQALESPRPEARDSLLAAALEGYERALRVDPQRPLILQNMADAWLQRGDRQRAEEAYVRALSLAPGNAAIWVNYGQSLYTAGDLEAAAAAFQQAIHVAPELPQPYNNLANVYSRQGREAQAAALYLQALEREPEERVQVLLNLCDTYRRLGRLDAARRRLDECLRLAPGRAATRYQEGRLARAEGDLTGAATAFQAAVSADSGMVRAWAELGEVLALQGKHGPARAAFRALLRRDPHNPRGLFGLGESAWASGHWDEARRAYSAFLQYWSVADERTRQARKRLQELESRP